MELLKQRIRRDGIVKGNDVLKVDGFLNHQMDVALFEEIGREFLRRFEGCGVNKILTIEASGIGIACVTAQFFRCPVIFAKKSQTRNIAGDVYTTKVESFTHGKVYDVVKQAGADLAGAGIVIEKAFQPGGDRLRAKGIRVESLARVKSMSEETGIEFVD